MLPIQLVVVDRGSCTIKCTENIKLDYSILQGPSSLYESIRNAYPDVEIHGVYWRYSATEFFNIHDYFSYLTAVSAVAPAIFYVLVNGRPDEHPNSQFPSSTCLVYATKNLKSQNYYTVDMKLRNDILEDLSKGLAKPEQAFIESGDDLLIKREKEIFGIQQNLKPTVKLGKVMEKSAKKGKK